MAGNAMIRVLMDAVNCSESCSVGDVDGNQDVNVLDVINVVNHIVGSILLDSDGECAADMNADGNINVLDITLLINVIIGD